MDSMSLNQSKFPQDQEATRKTSSGLKSAEEQDQPDPYYPDPYHPFIGQFETSPPNLLPVKSGGINNQLEQGDFDRRYSP